MVGDVVGLAVGGAVGGTADFPPLLLVAEVPSSSPLDLPLPPFALWPRRSRVTDAPWVIDAPIIGGKGVHGAPVPEVMDARPGTPPVAGATARQGSPCAVPRVGEQGNDLAGVHL